MSRPPTATSTGGSSTEPRSGLSGPNGFATGWSLLAVAGSASRHIWSYNGSVRNTSEGQFVSDAVLFSPPKYGQRRTHPATRTGAAARLPEPTRTARWCAMLAPAESPETKTLAKSAAAASHGSPAPAPTRVAWERSQEKRVSASWSAAGRRRTSGAGARLTVPSLKSCMKPRQSSTTCGGGGSSPETPDAGEVVDDMVV
nr:unnamed protein product [Digitaria exilis]